MTTKALGLALALLFPLAAAADDADSCAPLVPRVLVDHFLFEAYPATNVVRVWCKTSAGTIPVALKRHSASGAFLADVVSIVCDADGAATAIVDAPELAPGQLLRVEYGAPTSGTPTTLACTVLTRRQLVQ